MAFSTHTDGYAPLSLVAFLARFSAKAQAILRTLQVARMISTLSSMSDGQLSQIGISRADIPQYAEKLMER